MSQPDGTLLNYERIAEDLRGQIRAKALPPGAPLPSQSQLMKQYGASSLTVQKAMSLLREEGWAVSRPGKGAFVSQKKDTEDAFRTVATALEQQIRTGTLAPGGLLPSRETLAEQFGTSLTVIDTALTLLAQQQWLTPDETGRSLDIHVQRADHPKMTALLTQPTPPQGDAGGDAATRSRVEALEGALTGALEQIAELRERVETLEASSRTRKAPGRKTS
ncbi:GntR family transcriptional regulator [Streptomyces sp. NBC_01476]|uniref:GntR family transcriptional regulator n=1 Tax=Streptomyces sp. NBC_01476 TaxID=2903881 RepID=UPI002E31DD4A|nr:GntR family transcriptional regulator [Streptomyces sp. NBC_01476]